MDVKRIKHEGGSRVVPALDPSWSDMQKLEWKATVASLDSGIEITVNPSDYRINGHPIRNRFDVSTPRSTAGGFTYEDAWLYIRGIEQGAKAARR